MAERIISTHRSQGIALPVKIVNGRYRLVADDAYIQQLMTVAFGDCSSDNPFEDLGLGEAMIFGINDSMTEGEILARVKLIMDDFEENGLAKLIVSEPPTFEKDDGDLHMLLPYMNLETQERGQLDAVVPSGDS
tara:strand:- start:1665 stop:2066 length:402 start_codon:yes stop_codon:yes gene_type:complete